MAKIKPLTGNAGDFSGIVLKAAARGDAVAVRHYLKKNPAWLNREGPHGRTLLWEAAYKGRTSLVSELIRLGADVNPLGSYYTPMLVELSALAVARGAGRDGLEAAAASGPPRGAGVLAGRRRVGADGRPGLPSERLAAGLRAHPRALLGEQRQQVHGLVALR